MTLTPPQLAKMIDHTLLKADAGFAAIEALCEEAKTYQFYSVCVNPAFIQKCHEILKGSSVKIATVVGFPLGASTTATKVFETGDAITSGAKEIDMVLAIGFLKSGDTKYVENEIRAVVKAAQKFPVKVILETALLNEEEKRLACEISVNAGAAFVKTSTGFSTAGATIEDIKLMRSIVGKNIGVKASGGVRTLTDAMKMMEAGANRLGTSASVTILETMKSGNS